MTHQTGIHSFIGTGSEQVNLSTTILLGWSAQDTDPSLSAIGTQGFGGGEEGGQ
jgi:hypothetical protein